MPRLTPTARGSSPGGWGEAHRALVTGQHGRFIPRRLGRGESSDDKMVSGAVHPQAAGERAVPLV